ncbi:hypothetical protein K6V25_13490 [Bacteroides salyersiae]|uniref:hypothetical protein n=1 Tax=Bacteroides salyersiae TaxID=291644 RepID=UPI00189FC4A9|nr:hypothetical protein [Bacteroides salyersiae]UBD63961.1 hypothetical protein K6V25_13490 [Bacteroides salyersiae]
MRTEFYKKHAEDILSNLESIQATFKELVDSNKIVPRSYAEDGTPGTNDIYSCKFKEVQDDFINLVHAFDQEMPFYKKMISERLPRFDSGFLEHYYNDDCNKLKSLIEKFIHYLSFYLD